MTDRDKVDKYFLGLNLATNNFAFEVKAMLVRESTYLESRLAKLGLNGPHD